MNSLRDPIHVVLFDLGDTLIYFDEHDRQEVFARAHQSLLASLQASGLPLGREFGELFFERMEDYYRERDTEFIEYTTHYVLCNTLADLGFGGQPDEVLRRALQAFHHVTQAHWIPEDDALPTLARLRDMGYRMGLVSNAADDLNTQDLVDKAGLRPFMEVIVSSAAVGVRKPNPRIFQHALDSMEILPQNAAMVGDTLGADILGARNAGLVSIWIARRGDTPANRAHRDTIFPDAQIATLAELPELLTHLNPAH